jgi:4-hydroxyacetophenone monooxygenase
VKSWYKNDRNRLTVTSPWRLLDYWAMTKVFDPADFVTEQTDDVSAAAS